MTTFRQALNRVLEVLAEDQISSDSSPLSEYQTLVANFMNQIKEEIEDAHNWRSLRTSHTATITADTFTGDITNATERSRLVRILQQDRDHIIPLVWDVTDPTEVDYITEMDLAELLMRQQIDPDNTVTNGSPSHFAISAGEDGTSLDVLVWPTPATQRTLRIEMITPQDWLTASDLATTIKIPVRPLVLGTLWYALEERGEELGVNTLFSEERFRAGLNDSISRDNTEAGEYFELVRV